MDTSAISYRVADFLKKHPPFQAMEEGDLLELAARGRVRFHEANEYILWQGEPHKLHVFVIQQGTVSLWDEADGRAALRDVRGAGDMLGIERFTDAPCCLHSARSASDVVIYSFPASDFEDLVLKYPYARQFVEAHDTVTADYQWAKDARDPQKMFLHDVVGRKALESCSARTSIRDVAQSMLTTGSDAIAVVDGDNRVQAVVTVDSVLAWVAAGAGDAEQPITGLLRGAPPAVGSAASVIDGVLAMRRSRRRRAGRDVGRLLERPASCARDVERHRPGIRRSAHLDPAGDSARGEYPGTARAQSPRARIGPSVPHQRRLARLARTLHVP